MAGREGENALTTPALQRAWGPLPLHGLWPEFWKLARDPGFLGAGSVSAGAQEEDDEEEEEEEEEEEVEVEVTATAWLEDDAHVVPTRV